MMIEKLDIASMHDFCSILFSFVQKCVFSWNALFAFMLILYVP